MFSASGTNTPGATVRTSRRRQRAANEDGSIPKAKRQRSALNDQTFLPPDGAAEIEETKHHKTPTLTRRESPRAVPVLQKEIAVRGKKQRSGERSTKGDGSAVLTTNDIYTVSKLPALPDRLRADAASRQHGAIYSDSGYALTLTHSHAIVWPYAVHLPSPETFTFALPHPSKHASDPLPLGSLVSASASSPEPGLVVVMPTTGKITYWESIASAATLDLRLQRNGVELSIPGMSGEKVIQILNAESAGFMLAFSSGRIAYMRVRDDQGRPSIHVHIIHRHASASTGIFGSIRHALSSSQYHGDIAAMRAGRTERIGERNIVLATKKGKIQSWDIQRGGQNNNMVVEHEGKEAIVQAIKAALPVWTHLHIETFELLDFAYSLDSATETAVSRLDENEGLRLLLLTSLTEQEKSHYFLVEVTLYKDQLYVGDIRPLESYSTPIARKATSSTRLYLPDPALAFVVFDRAVLVVSLAKDINSPNSQLMSESHLFPRSFEDVVDLTRDMNIEIVGSGMEEPSPSLHGMEDLKMRRHKAKYPSVIILVRGGGVLRVAATNVAKLQSDLPPQVTAKSKLEQAIFFGTQQHNPINFSLHQDQEFPPEDVCEAALELSRDILKSKTPHIPSVTASVEQNLRRRSKALQDMAKYLQTTGVKLDRNTKWKLLWDAEKMAAATVVWKSYDACVSEKPEGQKRGLLTELVEYIHEDYKTNPVAEAGELDRVRHWFINDIDRLELALPWAYQVIKYTYADGQKGHDAVMTILSEANDLVLGALEGAFEFRTLNAALYGLQDEQLKHGILEIGYDGLPEIWTSNRYLVQNISKQVELAAALLKEYWGRADKDGAPSSRMMKKVREEHPSLIDMCICSNYERIRWSSEQGDSQIQHQADDLRAYQSQSEDNQIKMLSNQLGMPNEAITLAQRHEILPTLASVLTLELNDYSCQQNELDIDPKTSESCIVRVTGLQNIVNTCFDKFGMKWATALYELEIQIGVIKDLFDEFPQQRAYLTEFLRARPEYAKLAWIHEVTRENDFDHAASTLLHLGLNRERDIWSKKIELSIGKLARLAGPSFSQDNGVLIPDGGKKELATTNDQLDLIKIQDTLYNSISGAIFNAIDEDGELDCLREIYGNKALTKLPSFSNLLEQGMSNLVKHDAMDALVLIDLLALMVEDNSEDTLRSQQFYLALKALEKSGLDKDEKMLHQRVIWRRCMLRDNWTAINNTELRGDQESIEGLQRTCLYLTFKACLENRLFDEKSIIEPMAPDDILGACTDNLGQRFTGLDVSIREGIMKDFRAEDDAFKAYIDKDRLDKWHQGVLEEAKSEFARNLEEETNNGMMVEETNEALEQKEKKIADQEKAQVGQPWNAKPRLTLQLQISERGEFRGEY
ncbi:Non-repetitive/WGA-negative nucleoporin C-terminal-domain-containing protein [Amylocarpus encephaloides]|uniref:Non-repetitive/WGA-negative nucleoporin C-terminal-domain-containing protein n=1 Tax=Amylocarpus encephaloides TaxID=45428 RepID=A0A9P7YIU2_9HELO|nr:Non-repetitive/WGA-negative nucleoporin C-terminal-domain-containing protein [Amylocarpus encephaloides]